MRPSARHTAIAGLLRHVEDAIPTARIGNTSAEPVLWLPAPIGFAVWVAFDKGVYVAFISRRTGRAKRWNKYIGHDRETPAQLWPRVSSWLNAHPELSAAWEHDRRTTAAVPVTASTAPTPASLPARPSPTPVSPPPTPRVVVDEDFDDLPEHDDRAPLAEYEPILGDVGPVDGPLETLQIQISASTAENIRRAVAQLGLEERDIFEVGARMYLSHAEGSLFMVGGWQPAAYLRSLTEQWGDGDAHADDFLIFLLRMAMETHFGEKIVMAYNQTKNE